MNTRSLLALVLAASLTSCARTTPPPAAERPKPPAALIEPLGPEPAVPAPDLPDGTVSEAAAGSYIVGLRDFACRARARFNALATWAIGGAWVDPDSGRCSK